MELAAEGMRESCNLRRYSRWRLALSDPLARTSYGWQDGTWSFPWAAKGAIKTSRPVDARLWAAGEDQAYNLSFGASTHDLKVTVTSTRRVSIVHIRSGKDQG